MPNRKMRQRSTRKRRPDVTASEGSDISGDSPRTPSGDSSGDEWIAPTEISSRPALSDTQSISDQNSTRSGRSGEASVVLAEGLPLEQSQFESWDAFHSYIGNYMRQSYQSFRVRTNNKVADRNNKIKSTNSTVPLIPEEWVQYGKTLVCTHAGTYYPRGKGKRMRQQSRALKCGAKINACVQVVDKVDLTFAVRVTSAQLEHNHALDKRTFAQYPSNRMSIEPGVLDTVNELRKAGAKKKSILRFIQEHSTCSPNLRDVHNLVRSLKENEKTAATSAKRLKKWMIEFSEEAGNVGRIFVDRVEDKKIATCITLQTKHMREMFDRFPEVLMIDATHGTNSSKYKVFSIMAHDVFGKGQFVQHAVVQNERRPTLLTALEEFKKHNPAWTKIQCILIDKDFTEMSVLKTVFPDVTVLLCQFHAIKYLREKIASTDYTFSAWQKLQLQGIVNLMVYAQTEREYMKHRRYLTHIVSIGMRGDLEFPSQPSSQLGLELGLELGSELGAGLQSRFGGDYSATQCGGDYSELGIEPSQTGSVGLTHEFDKYITKNWDNCRHMWCAYKRQNAVTLGNNTNNRIEASWKQLKDLVDSFMGVDECIASIMYHQTREEKLFNDRVYKLTVVQNANYDCEMALLANLVSEHACELIHDQYTYAVGRATYTYYEPVPEVYMIQNGDTAINALDEPRAEYSVTKRNWECSCLFMTTRLLPCRHVFFIRKALGFDTIIPTQLLSSRWLLSSIRAGTPLDEFTSGSFAMGKIIREGDTAWDSNRKYREARAVATSISENMSGLGMAEYRVAMDALRLVAKLFKRGKFDVILRADGFQTSENDTLQVQDDTASLAPDAVSMDADGRVLGPPSDNIDDPTPLNDPTELPLDGHACSPALGLGSPAPELGARDTELGAQDSELSEPVDQAPPTPRLVEIGNDEDFDLQSPPKARGRPKQKPKAVKAKRSLVTAMVQEDSDMHEMQLNLQTVANILTESPTYASSAATLKRFKVFVFIKKPRAPIPHEIAKLPATKQMARVNELVRVFPMDLLRKCDAKVTSYQSTHRGVAERDIAVELVGVGVFATSTLAIMKRWHRAKANIELLDKALEWIKKVDTTSVNHLRFIVDDDPELPAKLASMELLSLQTEALDLAEKGCLSDETLEMLTQKLFGSEPSIVVISPASVGVVLDGNTSIDRSTIESALFGLSSERVLIPINCNNNHWCSIMVDLAAGNVFVYDSMRSSYTVGVRAVAQILVTLLPPRESGRYHVKPYESYLGDQTDSYNCGVYVLLAFEIFCGAEPLGMVDRKTLQCLRYRYLSMCL